MASKKIDSFTGLRFVMIMVIVLSHLEFPGTFGGFYKFCFSNASFAVDFFFLLSGFGMMYGSLKKIPLAELKCPSLKDCFKYGINHIKKLYPLYIVILLICLVFKPLVSHIYGYYNFSLPHESVKLLVNILLLQSLTGMTFFTHAFNGVSWFLSTLFCIYIAAPALIYFVRKNSQTYFSCIFFSIIDIFFMWVLVKFFSYIEIRFNDVDGLPSFGMLAYGSPYRRIFYVLLGMEVAMLFNLFTENKKAIPPLVLNILEVTVAVISIFYSIFRIYMKCPEFDIREIFDGILVSAFLFIFAFDEGILSKLFKNKVLQHLGNLSMYIFLIHFPLVIYLLPVIKEECHNSDLSMIFGNILVLILTFVISWLVYRKSIKNVKTVNSTR